MDVGGCWIHSTIRTTRCRRTRHPFSLQTVPRCCPSGAPAVVEVETLTLRIPVVYAYLAGALGLEVGFALERFRADGFAQVSISGR
jgi:hypothetical protein